MLTIPYPSTCLIHEVRNHIHHSQTLSFPVLVTLGLYLGLLLLVSVNLKHKHLPAANENGSFGNIASNKNQRHRKWKGEVGYNFLITISLAVSFGLRRALTSVYFYG